MHEAAHTLTRYAHPTTPIAHHNLGESLVGLGDLRRAAARSQAVTLGRADSPRPG